MMPMPVLKDLRPVPIKKADYAQGLQPAASPEAVKLHMEEMRILELQERFMGVFWPVAVLGLKVWWEVRFPPGSRWRSGPPGEGPRKAMYANFEKNKGYIGYKNSERQDPKLFLNADKILDQQARDKTIRAQEEQHEIDLRIQSESKGS